MIKVNQFTDPVRRLSLLDGVPEGTTIFLCLRGSLVDLRPVLGEARAQRKRPSRSVPNGKRASQVPFVIALPNAHCAMVEIPGWCW